MLAVQQLAVYLHLPHQGADLGVSLLDQMDKLSNHACALRKMGCELAVLICKMSAGSGVAGSLGVGGGSGAQVVLQACNAGSISSAASFQPLNFLGVCMGAVLLPCSMLQESCGFCFCSCL